MNDRDDLAFELETVLIHAGGEPDTASGAVAPPLHLSTTFEHGAGGETPQGYLYARDANPTQDRLERALAAVEGGAKALFFASGMAAAAARLQALPAGTHAIFPRDLYHGVRELMHDHLPRWGIDATVADLGDLEAVAAALRPETRLIWAESPSNPLLEVVDLAALAEIAHRAGAELVVDGTFTTPVVQRPLELGADAVVHSATKYLGGHSDVMGGALILARESGLGEELHRQRTLLGAVASPFAAWWVLRGLRSLACRVERHATNALAVARTLEGHPALERVHYPGLASHPGHAIARRQMRNFGGMVSIEVRGGRGPAVEAASRLRLFTNATSLGGVESLVEHRASIEGGESEAPPGLLRLSVGLEHPDDLVADLLRALSRPPF